MTLNYKKIKKVVLPFALVGMMNLSGCSSLAIKSEKDKSNLTEATSTDTTTESNSEELSTVKVIAPTTEETTEKKEETSKLTDEEDKKLNFYKLAAETYNKYTDFYSYTGMAYEDKNGKVNIDRIENFIKVINGEVADLTPSQIADAKEDINYILLSQDLVSNLDDVIAADLGYITIGKISMVKNAKLSEFASDEETKEITKKYEKLRDKVQKDLNTSNKVSDETKEELKKAVIQMEKDYLPDKNNMNTDVTAEGNKLLENLAKEALVELYVLATNETRIYCDEFPGGLKLAAETDEERDIQSKAMIHGVEILTDSEREKYAKMTMEIIVTKYEQGVCAHLQNLADHAKDNSNVHSNNDKIASLRAIKEELKTMKLYTNSKEYDLTFNL